MDEQSQQQQCFQIDTSKKESNITSPHFKSTQEEIKSIDVQMHNDTVEVDKLLNKLEQEDESSEIENNKFKLKTRRQTRGIMYFNRKKPQIQITIGSLEEYYKECQYQKFKRRKLNMTADEILRHGSEDSDDDMIDLQPIKSKLNKSFLYENWQDDFEKEKKRLERASKKRKREMSRSKSRSPTPISKQLDLVQNTRSRKGSLKQNDECKITSPQATDTEEENKNEIIKIKNEIMSQLHIKDEPMTIIQLSYNTKYAKKYCDEALKELLNEKKIRQKEIAKNNIVYYIVQGSQEMKEKIMADTLICLEEEMKDHENDIQVQTLKKQIKDLKLQPTKADIENNISLIRKEIDAIKGEIESLKQRQDFLGESAQKELRVLKRKIERTAEIYKKRKSACIDMLDYLDQHLNEEFAEIIAQAGIDMEDITNNKEIDQILFGEEEVKENDIKSPHEDEDVDGEDGEIKRGNSDEEF